MITPFLTRRAPATSPATDSPAIPPGERSPSVAFKVGRSVTSGILLVLSPVLLARAAIEAEHDLWCAHDDGGPGNWAMKWGGEW